LFTANASNLQSKMCLSLRNNCTGIKSTNNSRGSYVTQHDRLSVLPWIYVLLPVVRPPLLSKATSVRNTNVLDYAFSSCRQDRMYTQKYERHNLCRNETSFVPSAICVCVCVCGACWEVSAIKHAIWCAYVTRCAMSLPDANDTAARN